MPHEGLRALHLRHVPHGAGPAQVYSVSIAKVEPTDLYELKSEYHFCPQCLRLVETRINRTVEVL